jgi:hypothetical protein
VLPVNLETGKLDRAPTPNVDAESANRGEADERIERIYLDFDKVSYFLGSNTIHICSPGRRIGHEGHVLVEKTVEVFWKGLALPEMSNSQNR